MITAFNQVNTPVAATAVTTGTPVSMSTLMAAQAPNKTVRHALIAVQTNGVRYTTDGTTPVTGGPGTGVGIPVVVNAIISFMDPNIDYIGELRAMKLIGNGGTANIDVAFFD